MPGLPEGRQAGEEHLPEGNSHTKQSQWEKPTSPLAPSESKTKIVTESPPEAIEKGASPSILAPNSIKSTDDNSSNAPRLTILSPVEINAQHEDRTRKRSGVTESPFFVCESTVTNQDKGERELFTSCNRSNDSEVKFYIET